MAGTLIAVGVVACTATLALGLVAAGTASAFGQHLAGAADAAALAAADAASGAVSGIPCERATQVAVAAGVMVQRCELDGLVATVVVGADFGRLPAVAAARAGPPP